MVGVASPEAANRRDGPLHESTPKVGGWREAVFAPGGDRGPPDEEVGHSVDPWGVAAFDMEGTPSSVQREEVVVRGGRHDSPVRAQEGAVESPSLSRGAVRGQGQDHGARQ